MYLFRIDYLKHEHPDAKIDLCNNGTYTHICMMIPTDHRYLYPYNGPKIDKNSYYKY